jgi:hypothetical protein
MGEIALALRHELLKRTRTRIGGVREVCRWCDASGDVEHMFSESCPKAIAALFVETDGVYFGIPGVDPWDVSRDARLYAGPRPAVVHPPCERWGRYWGGGPNPRARRRGLGDDDGCFEAGVGAVRKWGGVLEHPEASHAWAKYGIARPPRAGGWILAEDGHGGWTCCVEQGHYGHAARKATWLYSVRCELPNLAWGPSEPRTRIDPGYHSAEEARAARASGAVPVRRLSSAERVGTPVAFRDVLIAMARSAHG